MTSGSDETAVATTGVAHANASRATRGMPSSRVGSNNTSAARSASRTWVWLSPPRQIRLGRSGSRREVDSLDV